jgi:outer membrane protein TolC
VIGPLLAISLAAAQAANAQPAPGAPQASPPAAPEATPPPAAARNALTLEQAIAIALQNNPDLLRSQYQAQSAGQDEIISRAAILPILNFNGSTSRTRQGAGNVVLTGGVTATRPTNIFVNWNASIVARQLLFDGGKWWNNLEAAGLQYRSTVANVEEQRLQTIYAVEQRFYELVRAQRQLKVLGDAAARSRDQADFTQRLFEGGRATQADVYAARANRDNDEINRLGQEARVELARQDLAITVAVDPAAPLAIVEPAQMQREPAPPPPAEQAVEKALAVRPSLKAFALTAESQRKFASAARGDYWPTVSLQGSFGRNTQDLSTFTSVPLSQESQLSGSVILSWNLFNGFATKAAAEKADIAVATAEVDYASGRRAVASDVERAIAQLATARQQARVAAQSVQTSSENLRLALTRQRVGVGTQLEVRDAELKLTQSELARDNALVDGREAEAALRRASGG